MDALLTNQHFQEICDVSGQVVGNGIDAGNYGSHLKWICVYLGCSIEMRCGIWGRLDFVIHVWICFLDGPELSLYPSFGYFGGGFGSLVIQIIDIVTDIPVYHYCNVALICRESLFSVRDLKASLSDLLIFDLGSLAFCNMPTIFFLSLFIKLTILQF